MKRLIMLAVLCAFVLSAAAASAADIKASGAFVTDAVWQRNWDFSKGNDAVDDNSLTFDIATRADLNFQFIANENLKGVFNIRHQENWGQDSYQVGQNDDTLQIRQAYIDFMWPGTQVNIKVGKQGIALPNAVGGSYILDNRMGALVVSAPVSDSVTLTGAYLRAVSSATEHLSNLDFYALMAPMTFDNISVTPFIVLGNAGNHFGATSATAGMQSQNATANEIDGAYWLGVTTTMTFGDFTVAGDLDYGNVSGDKEQDDRSGWYFAVSTEYAGLDFMTPEAYFLYSSGEDDDVNNGSERMPTIAPDWGIGSFFFGGDEWLNGSINDMDNTLGFWALGISLKDIASFADGLTHTAHLIYARGTNDDDAATGGTLTYGRSLTEDDSLWELDFNTYYQLYDELSIGLELGYVHLDADEDAWGNDKDGGSAYKVGTGIAYKF